MLEKMIIGFADWFIRPLGYKVVKIETTDVDLFV